MTVAEAQQELAMQISAATACRRSDPTNGRPAQDNEQVRFWSRDQSRRRRPDHPVIEAVYGRRAHFLRTLVNDVANPSVLDVGCGNGVMTHHLTKNFARVCPVDFSTAMLCELDDRVGICAEATLLPFAPRSFDLVVASHLLHHMPAASRTSALREFGRIARRWVVVYEPNRNSPLVFLVSLLKKSERLSLRFSRRYVEGAFRNAGLDVVDSRVEGMIPPNKTPLSLLTLAKAIDRRPVDRLGFYTRTIASVRQWADSDSLATTRFAGANTTRGLTSSMKERTC